MTAVGLKWGVAHPTCEAVDGPVDHGLAEIEARLFAARDLLDTQDLTVRNHVRSLLTQIDDSLLPLACDCVKDPRMAALLVRLRDELGGHLFAAAVLDEAARPRQSLDILGRAVEIASARVHSLLLTQTA